ncbi:hypothetical protein GS942_21415 [Rhodococcus hoagii]|nr:hypothetical protein [Prescottella equi]
MNDSTSQLVPFQYGNERVRVLDIDGEPWFVLTDLCAVLGSVLPRKCVSALTMG